MPIPADYQELPEAALDRGRIEALWSFAASSAGRHQVLPDGRMDLVVRCRMSGDRVRATGLMIVGPSSRSRFVPVRAGDHFLGLRFRAGWGGACLGVDPSALRDRDLRGSEAVSALGEDAERIMAAGSLPAVREAVVAAGRNRVRSAGPDVAPGLARAIDLLHLTGGRTSLPDLVRATGMTERTLRRRLEGSVGLTFSMLASVIRFQRSVRLLQASSLPSLTLGQAAYEAGYSDQAHMTRDFRRHGAFTPGRRPEVALGSLPISGLAESFKTAGAFPA